QKLAPIWSIEKFRQGARMLEKYQVALTLLGKEQFEKRSDPYQSARLVIDLRNRIVHYKPITHEITMDDESVQTDDLERALKGKFNTNPFSGDFPVVMSSQPDK